MDWKKDKPTIGPLDTLLRPIAIAPCSSDIRVLHGGSGPRDNLILGHEAISEIVEVGKLVKNFKPGDKVVVPCVTPDWNQLGIQQRGSDNAHDARGIGSFKFLNLKDCVFAEFFTLNKADANLVILPEDVSEDAALMAVDMMSTGFYGVEMSDVQLGDSVVVFGIGPVGLMTGAGAKLRDADRIYAIGTRPNCAEHAREYGATNIISYKDGNLVQQILVKEGGQVDRVIISGENVKF